MNVVIARLVWTFKISPKYYSDSEKLDDNRILLDIAAQKFSKGKLGFAGARPIGHKCRICGGKFWTERKDEAVCKRWECFRAYHCDRKGAIS